MEQELLIRYLETIADINRNMSSIIHLSNNLRYNSFQLFNHQLRHQRPHTNDLFFSPPPPSSVPSRTRIRPRRRRYQTSNVLDTFQTIIPQLNRLFSNPTAQQINQATEIVQYRDISTNFTLCPISQTLFEPTDSVMRVRHCGHIFRESNLRHWFRTSSECPVCRHNIRDASTRPQSPTRPQTPTRLQTPTRTRDVSDNNPFRDLSNNPIQIGYSLSWNRFS